MNDETTVLDIFKKFPDYLLNYVVGFVLAILSDVTTTSLAVGSFFVGYATNVWWGLAVFFLVHTGIKIANAVNGAIVQQGRLTANAGHRLAHIFESTAPATPEKDDPSAT
jgi:hypothetical protein